MVAQKAGARAVILVAQFSWFFCRVKSRDHHKYNITIPAVCIEQDLAEKYLNASALKRIVYTRFSGNQNKLDKLNKGAIIFLQIFFLANLFAAVVLCAIRFIQFNFFSKSKFNASNIVHLFFLVGKNTSIFQQTLYSLLTLLYLVLGNRDLPDDGGMG